MNFKFAKYFLVVLSCLILFNPGMIQADESEIVPYWIKHIAEGWIDGKISDSEFINALEFMILNNIVQIPYTNTPFQDNGNFYVVYDNNPNSVFEYSARDSMIDSKYFDEQADYLNETFVLPYDVKILLTECNEDNAFYEPDSKQIRFCYEHIDSIYANFLNYYEFELSNGEMTEEQIEYMTWDNIDFTLYHELGHALIDIYELPITGLEENVVDQFSTKFLLDTEPIDENYEGIIGQDIIYNVGSYLLVESEFYGPSSLWDVHALDMQRFYNISCYAYGLNPDYNQDLIKEGYLPKERAESCESEYWKMSDSWDKLLSRYYK